MIEGLVPSMRISVLPSTAIPSERKWQYSTNVAEYSNLGQGPQTCQYRLGQCKQRKVPKDLEDSSRNDSGIDIPHLGGNVTSNNYKAAEGAGLPAQVDLPSDFRLGETHLRLVKVYMDGSEDEVRCETRIFNIHEIKRYIALSYTWGDTLAEDKNASIVLNGSQRLVGRNLWYFLLLARSLPKHFSEWLWIDALSIDQKNLDERMHQVNIMSKIFKNAERVVVWLGPNDKSGLPAMHSSSKGEWDTNPTAAMKDICERPYWRRLWVVQELRAARRTVLMYGSQLIPWQAFETRLSGLTFDSTGDHALRNPFARSIRDSPASHMVNTVTRKRTGNSLWYLIQDTKHLCCQDPRDRVYALLSVANVGHEGIEADYDMTIPALLNRVLHNQHKHSPPTDIKQVFAQCTTLENIFGLRRNAMNTLSKRGAPIPPSLQLDLDILKGTPGNDRNYYGYLRWAISYDHTHVIEVLKKAWRQQSSLGRRVERTTTFRGSCV
ncbi:hypothetical protein MBLNU13_g05456t1 [Cladosporium sp. NU13]